MRRHNQVEASASPRSDAQLLWGEGGAILCFPRGLHQRPAAALYGGTRLDADRCSIYLEFTGEDKNSDHPLRALYCATAIQSLSKQLLDKQGVQLELASAISHGELELSSSQLLNERILQEQVKILQSLLEKAVNGEILLNKNTSEHEALEDINISPLADDSPLFRVDKLHESGEQLVNQQLALLTRNL